MAAGNSLCTLCGALDAHDATSHIMSAHTACSITTFNNANTADDALGRQPRCRTAAGAAQHIYTLNPICLMRSPARQAATLQDGGGRRPAYNLRTLCRALEYARAALPTYGLQRSLFDGAAMAFLTQLAPGSAPVMERLLCAHLLGGARNAKVGASQLRLITPGVLLASALVTCVGDCRLKESLLRHSIVLRSNCFPLVE